ncbi:MAG: ACT domain-containing protein [Pseudomonadales bacterium]|nr:ACT domain-containing protein [Pseudomonadales bacterium]
MATAVVSTIGSDRPGLVAELSSLAQTLSLNIEDSRMTVLGGEFAVLMSVSGTDENLTEFENALTLLDGGDLAHLFRRTSQTDDGHPNDVSARPYRATVTALDHPGIVASIAGFFSERNINIQDLQTETTPAPHTGTPIFSVAMVANVPSSVRIHELRVAFEEFCIEADLDGELEAER